MRSCLSISYNDFDTSTYIVSLGRRVSYFAYIIENVQRIFGNPRTSNFTKLVKYIREQAVESIIDEAEFPFA